MLFVLDYFESVLGQETGQGLTRKIDKVHSHQEWIVAAQNPGRRAVDGYSAQRQRTSRL